jgi:hypothetical protein
MGLSTGLRFSTRILFLETDPKPLIASVKAYDNAENNKSVARNFYRIEDSLQRSAGNLPP